GARYDKHSLYKSTINPRVAALFKIYKKTSIRASYATAFKAPTPYQMYNSIAVDVSDGTVGTQIWYLFIPNKNLEPEEFQSIDFGIRHLFSENFSIEIAAYRNNINNLISNGSTEINPDLYPYANAGTANILDNNNVSEAILNGADMAIEYRNIVEAVKLNSRLFFSYMKGKETLPNGDKIDEYRNCPNYILQFNVNMQPFKNSYISIDLFKCNEWYSRQIFNIVEDESDTSYATSIHNPDNKHKGYFTLDVNAYYRIPLKFGELRINFKINNLFNKEYAGIDAFLTGSSKFNPQYLRTIYGGISFIF
ncbi:MAG: TonB-dependent receptor, partial [bacterium]|nr:TonB-dependent receptor [bacterium]